LLFFSLYLRVPPSHPPSFPTRRSSDLTMRPGDVLHIPRGYWHQATRNDQGYGYSFHATFGFVKRAGANWIAWLADRAREHELFRHDLERWTCEGSSETQQSELTLAATQLLEAHPPTEIHQ